MWSCYNISSFAEQQTKDTCVLGMDEGCIIPKPVPAIPSKSQYDVQMANGVVVDRYYLTTEPVVRETQIMSLIPALKQ